MLDGGPNRATTKDPVHRPRVGSLSVCFHCGEYPPGPHGGIGTLVQTLARGLVSRGHQVRVIGAYPADYPALDYEEDYGVKIWRLRGTSRRFWWVFERMRIFRRIAAWCRESVVDLVEVPDYGAPAAGWLSLPVPVVTRLSGSSTYFAKEMGRKPSRSSFIFERASLRRSDFLCSESHYLGGRTMEVFGLKVPLDAVIYNPVEPRGVKGDVPRSKERVVFAGTLSKKKGIISLLESWPRVRSACPWAELHIWGKDGQAEGGGSMHHFLERELGDPALSNIHFHGHVPLDDLLREFHSAVLVVLPSYAEGFALTPLHAMLAGCPTIYSRCGSGPELIEHNRTGLLIDPQCPEEIAAAIITLLMDDALCRRIGAAGQEHIQSRFCLANLLEQNEDFYFRCLKQFIPSRRGTAKSRGT
ncbi:MAG: glycosyltransferase family 4 protein [Acidobacteria bacterium]|nr:glycosyltransferase family 4 protein [Acidobacteriota bacterium]